MTLSAQGIISRLGLLKLEGEGGHWGRVYADDNSTAIYFLVQPDDFSAMHRLPGPEIYHFYAGAPLRMLLLYHDGLVEKPLLGIDLESGQRPVVVVPGGTWQGSETTGEWTLLGTTMAPGYIPEDFELGGYGQLVARYPDAAETIARLTRH
jgi:uncharacterized protein